jgi:hypothetical protein
MTNLVSPFASMTLFPQRFNFLKTYLPFTFFFFFLIRNRRYIIKSVRMEIEWMDLSEAQEVGFVG